VSWDVGYINLIYQSGLFMLIFDVQFWFSCWFEMCISDNLGVESFISWKMGFPFLCPTLLYEISSSCSCHCQSQKMGFFCFQFQVCVCSVGFHRILYGPFVALKDAFILPLEARCCFHISVALTLKEKPT
jgi:hypothetical protein